MDADYTNPNPGRNERDRAWIRELIDKLVDLETDNRANAARIKNLSAENTQLRNNVLDDPNLRKAFLEAAHKDHQDLVDRHAKSVEQYNSIIDQHLAINGDLKAEVERLTKKLAIADAEVFILRSDLKSKGAQGSPQE
ncbi:hypothetical protein UFOVP807_33 [uncultured Caudovirales phage]|uniref:Uncharacterized protein n=1 Tax=uncultured Caudovirales phage TaxID=2100421 RepID=A0A6J5P103_9CAUD|nr:hypothetical protein UFOVP339_8 [uncultured Caudovirales phage]CAB4163646.1 hypothetical protein UFOVP807_33 [uncultured Caudovirales phage]